MEIFKKIERVIVRGAIYIYCKLVYRAKIIGTENIPRSGAILICANHKSFLDPPLIEVTCKRPDVRFLARKSLAKNKLFAHLGNLFGEILVEKDARDMKAVKEVLRAFKNDEAIAIFPEGTRKGLEKGESVKNGAAFFALNSDAVIIPAGIKGGERPFKKVTITYGKPIDLSEYKATKKEKETVDKVTNKIMENIIELTK